MTKVTSILPANSIIQSSSFMAAGIPETWLKMVPFIQ